MPSFEYLISSAPVGFVKGCSLLSALSADSDQYNAVISQALNSTSAGTEFYIEEKKTIEYILKARLLATPKPTSTDFATALDSLTILSRDSIAILVDGIESFYSVEQTVSTQKQGSSAGKISNFKWRLGVAVSSNSCKNLSTPYVAVSFAVTDSSGEKHFQNAELSYSEFQDFYRTFREVATVMDEM